MNPTSKIDHFEEILESGVALTADFACFKFCYVDIDHTTDVEALFQYYQDAITYLQNKFPNLKIITVSVPLMTKAVGIKAEIKKMLGRLRWAETDNIRRNLFNGRLRNKYRNPVFDLADIEATLTNGKKGFFTKEKNILLS